VVFAPVLFLLLIHRAKLTAKKALLITVKVLLTIVLGGLGFFLALLIWMGGVAGGTAVLAGGAILPGKLVVGLIPVVAALIVLLLLWSGKSYL